MRSEMFLGIFSSNEISNRVNMGDKLQSQLTFSISSQPICWQQCSRILNCRTDKRMIHKGETALDTFTGNNLLYQLIESQY